MKYFQVTSEFTPSVHNLLTESLIGTPGKSMVYRHRNVDKKLSHIRRQRVLTLNRNNKTIATLSFYLRKPTSNHQGFTLSYIRFVAFSKHFRKGYHGTNFKRKSSLRNELKTILSNLITPEEKLIHYAYVDLKNKNSKALCQEFGFVECRQFTQIMYSRVAPKKTMAPQRIQASEKPHLTHLLTKFYAEHNFFHIDNLFFENNYFIIKNEDNEVLAGIQANLESWDIFEIPGIPSFILKKILPRIPILNKLITNPFRFLALEAVYFKPQQEHLLKLLIESLLAVHELHNAILFIDTKSPLNEKLTFLHSGPLKVISAPKTASVIYRSSDNIPKEHLHHSPAYISCFDLT